MNKSTETKADPSAELLKQWGESFARILQTACTFTPETLPPEMLRQLRASLFEGMARSWDEFMRSPQFLEGMKQFMDQAIAFRKMTNEMLVKARHELQGVAREDVDDLMAAIHHLEARVLNRMDDLAGRVGAIETRLDGKPSAAPTPSASAAAPRGPTASPAPPKRSADRRRK
jgi:hypothetical protein